MFVSASSAQIKNLNEMAVVITAQSIARVIQPLLPYRIDLGKNFIGSFFVESIENISIKKEKIFFSARIKGKDIEYAPKIGKKVVSFLVGDVNLPSSWEVSFKFDKTNQKLLIKPVLQNSKNEMEFSQGDVLLNTLLVALSGVEYPIELSNLEPIKSEFNNQLWLLNITVADVYAGDDKLFVELIPTVRIGSLNQQ
jgi:hypothetical protein